MKGFYDIHQGFLSRVVQLASSIREGLKMESARGLAHSKTWRNIYRPGWRDSVLECGSPLPLFPKRIDLTATLDPTPSAIL